MSHRLSHTMNDEGLLVIADRVYTGMTQLLSHPGHIVLDAGRAFTISLCDFIVLTAALGHWSNSSSLTRTAASRQVPTRPKSSSKASIAVIF